MKTDDRSSEDTVLYVWKGGRVVVVYSYSPTRNNAFEEIDTVSVGDPNYVEATISEVYSGIQAHMDGDIEDDAANVPDEEPDIALSMIDPYLPDEKRDIVLSLIDAIDSIDRFSHGVEANGPQAYYSFVAPKSGIRVVRGEFEESTHGTSLTLWCRRMNGEMGHITTVSSQSTHDTEWELHIRDEYDELEEKIVDIVEKAARKWL